MIVLEGIRKIPLEFCPASLVAQTVESACSAGDLDLMPELGRYPGEGNGNPLQYSGLENAMGYVVHEVTKSCTLLSDFHLFIHIDEFNSVGRWDSRLFT